MTTPKELVEALRLRYRSAAFSDRIKTLDEFVHGCNTGAHPMSHDTVKGTADGSNFQVGAAAVPAYLGVG